MQQELGFAEGHWDGDDFWLIRWSLLIAEKWNLINFLVGHIFLANEITRILYDINYQISIAIQYHQLNQFRFRVSNKLAQFPESKLICEKNRPRGLIIINFILGIKRFIYQKVVDFYFCVPTTLSSHENEITSNPLQSFNGTMISPVVSTLPITERTSIKCVSLTTGLRVYEQTRHG